MRKKREKGDGTKPHGLEEPQAARDLITGEQSCVVIYLHNLDIQLINITELCVLCMG